MIDMMTDNTQEFLALTVFLVNVPTFRAFLRCIFGREMRQYESSWFDSSKIDLSKKRVNRLGYFTEAEITTEDVPGVPDQVDVKVNVKEKPTGSVSVGAGYSSTEKVMLTAGINQDNAFGTGTAIGLNEYHNFSLYIYGFISFTNR